MTIRRDHDIRMWNPRYNTSRYENYKELCVKWKQNGERDQIKFWKMLRKGVLLSNTFIQLQKQASNNSKRKINNNLLYQCQKMLQHFIKDNIARQTSDCFKGRF